MNSASNVVGDTVTFPFRLIGRVFSALTVNPLKPAISGSKAGEYPSQRLLEAIRR
jgi:hypothetical protein